MLMMSWWALFLGLGARCVQGHIWFPTGDGHSRDLLFADCSTTTNPIWSSTTTDALNFQSFHLHISWSAGNPAQVTAAASFLSQVVSVAGASSSCSSVTDTSNVFCYSMQLNDYTSSMKQDPFYNQEAFIFVGASYFTTATLFASRYRSADMVATYDLQLLTHPNSNCAGLDHLRWSLFFQPQFPLNTCPFWFVQYSCSFNRRRLSEESSSLSMEHESVYVQDLLPEPDAALLSMGGPRASDTNHERHVRSLAYSPSSIYSTASCLTYDKWAHFTAYIVWNPNVSYDMVAKEVILTNFASNFGVSRSAVDCNAYSSIPVGASTTTVQMCYEVTTSSATNWFPYPYAYAPINVPLAMYKVVANWLMRNHDNPDLLPGVSLPDWSLNFFIVPNSGCRYYDFEKWSVRSDNNTIGFNYYPMLKPEKAFGTAAVGGVVPDLVVTASVSQCNVVGWNIYAPYLLNNMYSYVSTINPAFATKYSLLLSKLGTGTLTNTNAEANYNSQTLPMTTAYYMYAITKTDSTFATSLKYAVLKHTLYSVDATYHIWTQPMVLTRNSGCNDYDFMVYSGHTDAFDWPVNEQALGIAQKFGRRKLQEVERNADEESERALTRKLAALEFEAEQNVIAKAEADSRTFESYTTVSRGGPPPPPGPAPGPAPPTPTAPTTPTTPTTATLAPTTSSLVRNCIAAYSSDTYNSWTLHVTYVYNNPTSVIAASAACSSLGLLTTGGVCVATNYAYTTPTAGYSTLAMLGYTTPSSTYIPSSYTFAMNVPDAYLSQILQKVMSFTVSTNGDLSENLGWFLVPNLACTTSYVYANFYLQQTPRKWTATYTGPSPRPTLRPSPQPTAQFSSCQKGKFSTTGSGLCSSCSTGYYAATTGSTSCTSCAAGTYLSSTGASSSSICTSCSTGSYAATVGSSTCLSCSTGYYAATTGSTSCTSCAAGTYLSSTGASSSALCVTCPAGSYATAAGSTSCTSCTSGTFSSAVRATVSTVCTSCVAGHYASAAGSSSCTSCASGTYSTSVGSSTCAPCATLTYSTVGATSCGTSCPAGSYLSSSTCVSCAAGKSSTSSGATASTTCVSCVAGKYASVGSPACTTCSTGTYQSITGASTCISCVAGKYAATTGSVASTACTTCLAGKSSSGNGASACASCAAGRFASATGTTSCTACSTGRYLTSTGAAASTSCSSCAAGSYASSTGSISCTACAVSTFQSTTGASSCTSCASGTSSTVTGSTTSASCSSTTPTTCAAGTYGTSGVSPCTSCAAGRYASAAASTSCSSCAAGSYLSTTGATASTSCTNCPTGKFSEAASTACSNCLAGYFAFSAGSSACTGCSAGTSSTTVAATTSTVCASCAAGTYSTTTGATVCSGCAAGTFSLFAGASMCTSCAPGLYQSSSWSTSCSACAAGFYSATASTSCTACGSGFSSVASSSCNACTAGQYISGSSCTACLAGTISASGASVCSSCPAGSYATATGSTSCTSCTSGTFSSAVRATVSTVCTSCVAGHYASAAGSSSCTSCASGTYSTSVGSASCTACASGRFSARGSTSCSTSGAPSASPTTTPTTPDPSPSPTTSDTVAIAASFSLTATAAATDAQAATLKAVIASSSGLAEGDLHDFTVASSTSRRRRRLLAFTWLVEFTAVASLATTTSASAASLATNLASTLSSTSFTASVTNFVGATVTTSSVATHVATRKPSLAPSPKPSPKPSSKPTPQPSAKPLASSPSGFQFTGTAMIGIIAAGAFVALGAAGAGFYYVRRSATKTVPKDYAAAVNKAVVDQPKSDRPAASTFEFENPSVKEKSRKIGTSA